MKYTIGEFSKLIGISIYTLRYYEKEALIIPNRLDNGRRFYTENDLAWIQFIKRLKDAGMPIKQIQTYARYRSEGDKTIANRLTMLETHRGVLQKKIEAMQEHLVNLDEKINFYKKEMKKIKKRKGKSFA